MNVLFVYEDTLGIAHDALVVERALELLPGPTSIFRATVPRISGLGFYDILELQDAILQMAPFELVVFFEHVIYNSIFRDRRMFRYLALVVNIEWLLPQDEQFCRELAVDVVLFKNEFSLRQSLAYRIEFGRAKLVCCGWTSLPPREREAIPKSFDHWLHLGGGAEQKGSGELIAAWEGARDLPRLSVYGRLRNGDTCANLEVDGSALSLRGALSEAARERMQHRCGVHIYPSLMEGFGHALNQARAAGSVLLVTGGEPMMSFVEDGVEGFHFQASSRRLRRTMVHTVSRREIVRIAQYVANVSALELAEMGDRSRRRYQQEFADFMRSFASNIGF